MVKKSVGLKENYIWSKYIEMSSTFKLKPGKARQIADVYTLDETHRKMIYEFKKRKEQLPRMKMKLTRKRDELWRLEEKGSDKYTNVDIRKKSELKTEIRRIEEEIYDIENDVTEIDYYSKTGDILMDYYDILEDDDDKLYKDNPELSKMKKEPQRMKKMDALDRLNMRNKKNRKQKRVTRRRKNRKERVPQNDIRTYFGCKPTDDDNNEEKENNRAQLLTQFRILVDNEYIPHHGNKYKALMICDECNIDKVLIQSEGIRVCEGCGDIEMVIVESDKSNYNDSVPEKPGYPYKKSNHFHE